MIYGFVGQPGDGKSYLAASFALAWQSPQHKVFSNVYVDGGYKLTLDELIKYGVPAGSILFLDEVQEWANSRRWAELPVEFYHYFSQSRKAGLSLLWTAQDAARVDVTLREVTNQFFVCKALFRDKHGHEWRLHRYDIATSQMALSMEHYDKYGRRFFWRKWSVMKRYDTLATVGHATTAYTGYQYEPWLRPGVGV